ncbi:MAG: PH domain-containing protein [Acidimicrobiales bacterium]
MSFPARMLDQGEDVVVDVHPHWWYLAAPIAVAVVSLVGALTVAIEGVPTVARGLVLAVLVLAFAWLVGRYLRWVTTSLVITTYRLVDRRGVFAKSGREIPLDHLSDISYRQSLFGRLIGEGDLLLESAGRNSREVFPDLPRPAQIQNELYRQLNRRSARSSGGGGAPASIPQQIAQLDELRRRGIITAGEFETKKAKLLDRL